ncbi:MAG: hypothetical protein ACK5OX_08770 [Desertimonas sp.]
MLAVSRSDLGVIAVYPSHEYSPSRRADDTADYRWLITDDQMAHEELAYQWRLALGDDGLDYRVPLTFVVEWNPTMPPPALRPPSFRPVPETLSS